MHAAVVFGFSCFGQNNNNNNNFSCRSPALPNLA